MNKFLVLFLVWMTSIYTFANVNQSNVYLDVPDHYDMQTLSCARPDSSLENISAHLDEINNVATIFAVTKACEESIDKSVAPSFWGGWRPCFCGVKEGGKAAVEGFKSFFENPIDSVVGVYDFLKNIKENAPIVKKELEVAFEKYPHLTFEEKNAINCKVLTQVATGLGVSTAVSKVIQKAGMPNAIIAEMKSVGSKAQSALNRSLTKQEIAEIFRAHKVGDLELGKDGGPARINNYTPAQLRRKNEILKAAGFSAVDRRALMERGVVGNWYGEGIQTHNRMLNGQNIKEIEERVKRETGVDVQITQERINSHWFTPNSDYTLRTRGNSTADQEAATRTLQLIQETFDRDNRRR